MFPRLLRVLVALGCLGGYFSTTAGAFEINVVPRQSTTNQSANYVFPQGSLNFYSGHSNAAVTLDQHSLMLNGKRIMLFSGEFHPWRIPVPELWRDVLQKYKAAGFNGVSIYLHWGLTAPSANVLRFTNHNDVAKFYKVAKEVGILVIVRPGPYVNAETAGGGIPAWYTNKAGLARSNGAEYKAAWQPYILQFAKETAPYQYPDGPVIAVQSENEYATTAQAKKPGLDQHMQDIIDTLRQGGLTKIPTIHNDKNPAGQYALKGPGKVDLYGWDGYPLGFDCNNPTKWTELSTEHDTNHQRWNPAEPLALYEWQGGAFSYWSGPGYDQCYKLINEQFANVYYKNNYAAGAAIQNLYMTYGGTNWGNLQTTTIYSSYDYGAAIREDRTLTPKLDEIKLQAYFLHASPDYLLVGRLGAGIRTFSTSSDVYVTLLNSPTTQTNFYFVRQATNQKTTNTDLKLNVNTTLEGAITIPKNGNLRLAGRESKIIVTNYPFGSSKLQYSTAEVLTWSTFDNLDTIIVYALQGQSVEVAVEAIGHPQISVTGSNTITAVSSDKVVTISGTPSGTSVVSFASKRIVVVDKLIASGTWAPRLTTGDSQYDVSPGIPTAFIHSPYLVRSAVVVNTSVLAITGDLNATTTIDVRASSKIASITWNGATVAVTKTSMGTLQGTLPFDSTLLNVTIPALEKLDWACADSLPELAIGYDDSDWVVANKTSTLRPQKPSAGKFVLYSSEYGFHAGEWVWRGHFNGKAAGVTLSIQGGYSFGYTVFLNGHFLGSGQGSSNEQGGVDLLSATFNFTASQLVAGDNVLTVIHDSTGLNQDYDIDDEVKTPRGIRGYALIGNDFSNWKLAGNYKGENAPDVVRGPYNEGGWWYERVGAHLPGYDASSWNQSCTPYTGFSQPGVVAYRTKFDLDIPKGADVPLAFDFALDSAAPHRVLIYVNGWQFGRFLSSLGPQVSYPVPEGILNHRGSNEVLIAVWALNSGGAKLSKLALTKRASIATSKVTTAGVVVAGGWKELRGNGGT